MSRLLFILVLFLLGGCVSLVSMTNKPGDRYRVTSKTVYLDKEKQRLVCSTLAPGETIEGLTYVPEGSILELTHINRETTTDTWVNGSVDTYRIRMRVVSGIDDKNEYDASSFLPYRINRFGLCYNQVYFYAFEEI